MVNFAFLPIGCIYCCNLITSFLLIAVSTNIKQTNLITLLLNLVPLLLLIDAAHETSIQLQVETLLSFCLRQLHE